MTNFRPALPEMLNDQQTSVLVGTLLGDGCIAPKGRSHRLHIKHKAAHAPLVEFKYGIFKPFTTMDIHRFAQKLAGREYPCMQFATRSTPVFSKWHTLFYRAGRKIIPGEITRLLDPLAIAVWFMDDGAADHAGATFQTHSFEVDEVRRLSNALARFDIASNLRMNRGSWILYVGAGAIDRLGTLIEPYLLPTFEYKLSARRGKGGPKAAL